MAAKTEEAIPVDEQFLKDFLAKGGQAQDIKSGGTVDEENVDDYLEDVGAGQQSTTPNQMKLHNKAVKQGVVEDDEETQEEKPKPNQRQASIRETLDNVPVNIQPAIDKLGSLKTIGGIGLLLAVLIFLLFVVVQVNSEGDTRLKQVWYMLNGQASLQGRVQPGGGASGTFGNGTTPPNQPTTGQGTITTLVSPSNGNGFRSYTTF